jgi:hypothetical protein
MLNGVFGASTRSSRARVEIDKSGKIVIITADATDRPGETKEANEWDRI